MGKETQSVLLVLLGGVLIGITVSGRFTNYVKPGFGPLLLASGIILLLVAAFSLVQVIRADYVRSRAADPVTVAANGAEAGLRGDTQDAAQEHTVYTTGDVDAHGHIHQGSRGPWLMSG